MSLTFELEASRPTTCAYQPDFLRSFIAALHTLLLAHGEEVPSVRRAALLHCSLRLTLPPGFAAPSVALPQEEEEGHGADSSGTLPTPAQRHLELHVTRRSGVPVWESPLVTEQRSEAFVVARCRAGEEGDSAEADGATVWRIPPIDALVLAATALESLLSEDAATAPPLRAFRRRAFDLSEQRARVRAGGEQWTRAEQLKLLATLRAQARDMDGTEMSVHHRAVVAAFAQGELAISGGEEEVEAEGQQQQEQQQQAGAGAGSSS